MNTVNQVYYTAKRILTDIKPILTRLLTFMVIILILGSAFREAFKASDLDTVTIVYYSDDKGKYGEDFLTTLTEIPSIRSLVEFKKASSLKAAKKMVRDNKAQALLYIPGEFSARAESGAKSSAVEIYQKENTGVNALIVKNVMNSFLEGLNTAGVVYKMAGSLENYQFQTDNSIQEEPLSDSDTPDAMGYYAVAMLLMMLLYGAEYGRVYIGEDYLGVLGERMQLSPIRPFEQYGGKILGLSLVSFLQGTIIILFTKYLYHVNWGADFPLLLFIVFSFSVLTTAFGAMLSILTRDVMKAGSLVTMAVILFTFLAGGFVVMDFGMAQYLSPSYYAKTAIFHLLYRGNTAVIWQNTAILWGITLAFALISILSAGRKRA